MRARISDPGRLRSNVRASTSTMRSSVTDRRLWGSCCRGASSIPVFYKAQLPYFSDAFAALPMTDAATGKSDRPDDIPPPTRLANYVDDACAVMDATDAGKTILVGLSFRRHSIACILAAHHPDRVRAAILCGTVATIGAGSSLPVAEKLSGRTGALRRLGEFYREHWLTDYPGFADHFIRHIFSEPHSTRQIEDGVELGQRHYGHGVGARRWKPAASRPISTSAMPCTARSIVPCRRSTAMTIRIQPYARGQAVARADTAPNS